jgi:hypothetical protein
MWYLFAAIAKSLLGRLVWTEITVWHRPLCVWLLRRAALFLPEYERAAFESEALNQIETLRSPTHQLLHAVKLYLKLDVVLSAQLTVWSALLLLTYCLMDLGTFLFFAAMYAALAVLSIRARKFEPPEYSDDPLVVSVSFLTRWLHKIQRRGPPLFRRMATVMLESSYLVDEWSALLAIVVAE